MNKERLKILEMAEKLSEPEKKRFVDFLYRLVIKRERFTDEQVINMAMEA